MSFAQSFEFKHKTVLAIPPQSVAQGAAVGDGAGDLGVSRQGYEDVIVAVLVGAIDNSFDTTVTLEHADRDSAGDPPADGDFTTAQGHTGGSDTLSNCQVVIDGATEDNTVVLMRVRGDLLKEYVRPVATNGAGSGVALLSVLTILDCGHYVPAQSDRDGITLFK